MDRCNTPLFSAPDTLAIDDRDCRTGLAVGLLAAQHVEGVVDALQRPIIIPAAEIVIDRAAWRQIFRQRRPLAPGGENVHDPIHNSAHIDRSPVATPFGARDHRADYSPLFVRQVTRIAQLTAVIPGTIVLRPHRRSVPEPDENHPSQEIQLTRSVLGWTLTVYIATKLNRSHLIHGRIF